MKKSINWKFIVTMLMLVTLAGAVLAGCGQGGTYAAQKNYITIGCVCPLTGELAPYGEGSLDMEEAAVAQINENDGLYIDTLQRKLKVRFVVADSASTEAGAKEAARKLIEEEEVDVMISSSGTLTSIACAEVCEDLKVPFFSVGADNEAWLEAGPFSYAFNCAADDLERISALGEVWTEAGISSVGLMAVKSEDADDYAETFSAFCKDNGFDAAVVSGLDPSSPDFASALKSLSGAGVQALVCYMDGEMFSRAWQEGNLNSLGLSMCILENDPLFVSDIASVEPGTVIQQFYTVTGWDRKYPFRSSLTDESCTEIAGDWEDQFLSSAGELCGFKHASTEIAIDAVKLAMALDAESICSAARSLNADTVLGVVDFDNDGISRIPCSVLSWTFDIPSASWARDLASHSRLVDVEFDEE